MAACSPELLHATTFSDQVHKTAGSECSQEREMDLYTSLTAPLISSLDVMP